MQNFINELSKYLENNLGNEKTETPILDEILSKNQLSTANENSIRGKFDEMILKYAEQKFSNEAMYFVKDSKKTYWANNARHYNNNAFAVLKVENNKIEEMEISKKDMPKDIGVNDVFQIKNNKYVIDKTATAELKEGYFRWYGSNDLEVLRVELSYELDTKGFYQPIYAFSVV